ncbi:MAG: hypothetical protein HY527_22755 [Betaproteobacteria bacterium]|nr:hypothetical protein [Betaproteobacteria bacterium]
MRGFWIRVAIVAAALWAGACAQLPPSPQDLQAKRFEPVPDKAVLYVFRDRPDFVDDGAPITVDGLMQATTYPGTYLRLELAPGRHRVAGFASDAGVIELELQAGHIGFLQQSVVRSFIGPARSHFRPVDEAYGRQAVLRSELVGAR